MVIDRPKIANFSVLQENTDQKWPDWYHHLKKFRTPNNIKASWQVFNTIAPYLFLWFLAIRSVQLGYPFVLTLFLMAIAAVFLVRIFILFHDCAHYSFFKSKNINIFFGYFFSIFLFISFADWRFTHLKHHGKYANLDDRGYGDVWTMTKYEYDNASALERLRYRLFRNPFVMFSLGLFLLSKRPSYFMVKSRERIDAIFTFVIIFIVAFFISRFIGWATYISIQLPVLWLAGGLGIWLFYIHHQFDGVYWARKADWNPFLAAMKGASFYKLPAILNWFTSNICYHHIHHLDARIPNYQLVLCYNSIPELQKVTPLTFANSFSCFRLKLWDENSQKLVPFP